MILGYVRESPNWSVARQLQFLEAAGVATSKTLIDRMRAGWLENRRLAVKMLRRSDRLVVAGLGRLAVDHQDLREVLNEIVEKGAFVFDSLAQAEIRADKLDALESYRQARADWMGERTLKGRKAAEARGLMGGRPKIDLNPDDEFKFRRIWFDKRIVANKDAAAQIGHSASWCEKHWGRSGRPRNKRHMINRKK